MDNAVLYLRLSQDDAGGIESNSITNQREMLTYYAREHGMLIVTEYVDDGYSGVSFDRPGFRLMITDMPNKTFSTILVKDLSRLGRNNAQVLMYAETFFPEHNVRLIAVNDSIDTSNNDSLSLPLKSALNEMYAQECSRKSRAVKRDMALRGERTGGRAPLGYFVKANKLVVDPEKAPIIRKIFELADEYWSPYRIGKRVGLPRQTVVNILTNPVYTGTTVSRRHATLSLKVKTLVAESEWIITPGTHEPLVDETVYNRVQEWLADSPKSTEPELFGGLISCGSCGKALIYNKREYYYCSNCPGHHVQVDKLKEIITQKPNAQTINRTIARLHQQESDLRADVKQALDDSDSLRTIKVEYAKVERKLKCCEAALHSGLDALRLSELTREVIHDAIEEITVLPGGMVELYSSRLGYVKEVI